MEREIDLFWEVRELARQIVATVVYQEGERQSEPIEVFQSYADITAYDLSMPDKKGPINRVGRTIGYCKRGDHFDILLIPATIEDIEKDSGPQGKKIIIPAAVFSIKYNHQTSVYRASSKPHIKHSFPLSSWDPWFFSLYQDLEKVVFEKTKELNTGKV